MMPNYILDVSRRYLSKMHHLPDEVVGICWNTIYLQYAPGVLRLFFFAGVHVSFSEETEEETKTGDKLVSLVSFVSF